MKQLTLTVPIYLPSWLHVKLRALRDRFRPARTSDAPAPVPAEIDLSGDRDIEWSWVAALLPAAGGEALDFGVGGSSTSLIAARHGYRVTALDLEPVSWPYVHPGLKFLRGDILKLDLPADHFDLVINCSAIEHVGLPGRYGVTEDRGEGDLAAMARLRAVMKPGGVMLLTVPIGKDVVCPPWHRVYGPERLPRLLSGFAVDRAEYWVKDRDNRWVITDEASALATEAHARLYGLGCFVLARR
jgi:SAM-dependent methyltransferase